MYTSLSHKTKKIVPYVKGRRFIYVRYTTCYIVRASLPIHESFNGDFRQLLSAYRLQSCNSGVIFTAFTCCQAHTLPDSLSAFICNYSLHQRFCGHIIYLTMLIHYKVTKFTVSSIFLNIRVILLLLSYCSHNSQDSDV